MGRPPDTLRPELKGLHIIPQAAIKLHGERNAVELPIPRTAIQKYADRLNMSDLFVNLVQVYDSTLMEARRKSAGS